MNEISDKINIPNKIISTMIFGSHLYGTNTENSDMDYKGVYFPTKREILLNKVPQTYHYSTGNDTSKNSKDDVDIELFSIYEFIKSACEGQTIAIDMLSAPMDFMIDISPTWIKIVNNKSKFYTRNLKAFVSYARKQAAKYGVKGSRLEAAKEFIDSIPTGKYSKMEELWNILPINEHARHIEDNPNGIKQYQICGKTIQNTMTAEYALDIIKNFHNNYGERAKLAAENKGIDWKSISHAMRAAIEVKSILINGEIIFPLAEAPFLIKVKNGELDYLSAVAPVLENKMEELEELSISSNLPDKIDRKFWDDFIVEEIEQNILKDKYEQPKIK